MLVRSVYTWTKVNQGGFGFVFGLDENKGSYFFSIVSLAPCEWVFYFMDFS